MFSIILYFYPYLVRWSNLIDIFQTGWFNHQLDLPPQRTNPFVNKGQLLDDFYCQTTSLPATNPARLWELDITIEAPSASSTSPNIQAPNNKKVMKGAMNRTACKFKVDFGGLGLGFLTSGVSCVSFKGAAWCFGTFCGFNPSSGFFVAFFSRNVFQLTKSN